MTSLLLCCQWESGLTRRHCSLYIVLKYVLSTYQCQAPRLGQADPEDFDIFWKAESNSQPLAPSECQISHILTQQTILDVKIPTLGELHDVKFPRVAPLPPWGLPMIGALLITLPLISKGQFCSGRELVVWQASKLFKGLNTLGIFFVCLFRVKNLSPVH